MTTYFLFILLLSPIWLGSCKILTEKSSCLYNHSWKIISESFCSKHRSNNGMWLSRVVNLGSGMKSTWTNTNSRIWLKSSLGSRVNFDQELVPNQRIEVHILFQLMECDFSKLVVHILDLLVRKSVLIRELGPNRVRIPESTLIKIWNWITKLKIEFTFMFKFNFIEMKVCKFINGLVLVKFKMVW